MDSKPSCAIDIQTSVICCIILCGVVGCCILKLPMLFSWYPISFDFSAYTFCLNHPTAVVLFIENIPLDTLRGNLAAPLIKEVEDLTHLKFDFKG